MKSKDLKSLCETIATTVEATQPKQLAEGYINSLTEKARQVYSSINEEKDEDEDEKEESPAEEKAEDKAEMLMKKLAAKALKRAKKKAATNEEVELAEKAAPGYEDWASDPKVKASFKKQYGKDWKQVMYGRSWNMKKVDEETLDEAVSAKRMRIIRKYVKGDKRVPAHLQDFMQRSFKKKRARDAKLSDGRGAVGALETRMRRKSAALRARGIEPKGVAPGYLEEELAEGVKRMRRLRRAHVSGKGSRETADAYDKELSKVSASRLRRGGAPKQTVRGFFNDKPITPAANRAYTEFAKRAMAKASARGKKVFESEQLDEEWGGGFQSPQDAHREVQAGLRRDASIQRRKLVADIKAVHSGKMTKHAFTRKHKMRIDDLPLAKKMAASRAKAKAKYLAKKATKASAPKADSAPSVMEGMQLDEAGYKRLGRIKGAAYKAELASRGADPNTSLEGLVKTAKLKRAAAEQTAKVAAGMARRGDASPDAVRGGGSRIGPSGKYTQKAGKLANQRDRALARFRSTAKIARYQETGDFGGKLGKEGVAKKREMQKGMAKFRMDARHGDFGHEISPQSKRTSMRARYNYEKKYGRLKGK